MYSEYDRQTYYPKYSEDLVYTEVMLPDNAPPEYLDPSKLWNAVETFESGSKAQLARTYRVEPPNEWSYELATEVMQDYIRRNFVEKGMCAQFAIHDSKNKNTGQKNLRCHILLTLRSLDEEGHWMAKQKKEYLRDENGEKIPLIDKKTGEQKVDKQNRKQWKCVTIPTNDWSSKENAKLWRKDLADTINTVNQRIEMTEKFWEHRSFKEQGLEILPQIHLDEKASAMERAGVHTIRGNINREIIANNAVILVVRAAYEQAKKNPINPIISY
jgi:nickase